MQRDARSDLGLPRTVLRAAVLASSAGLAAFLVLRAGGMTGCDGPTSPPQQPTPDEAAKKSSEPSPPHAEAQPATPVAADPQPAPPSPAAAADAGTASPKNGDGGPKEPGKTYFPASKSGVFIERDPSLLPAREPAVQEQEVEPSLRQEAPG